jgi:hypothetical protein
MLVKPLILKYGASAMKGLGIFAAETNRFVIGFHQYKEVASVHDS